MFSLQDLSVTDFKALLIRSIKGPDVSCVYMSRSIFSIGVNSRLSFYKGIDTGVLFQFHLVAMSGLKSYDYPGFGDWARENLHYTQAIRVGERIHCAGQGVLIFPDTSSLPRTATDSSNPRRLGSQRNRI
jgi:hypothetical protein